MFNGWVEINLLFCLLKADYLLSLAEGQLNLAWGAWVNLVFVSLPSLLNIWCVAVMGGFRQEDSVVRDGTL